MAIQFNLLPWRDEVRAKREKNTKSILLSSVLIGIILSLGIYYYRTLQLKDNNAAKAYYSKEIAKLKKEKKEKIRLETLNLELISQIKTIESLRNRRVVMTKVLEIISEAIPKNLFLTEVLIKKGQFNMKGIAINEEEMTKMIRKIQSSPLFAKGDISYTTAPETKNNSIKEFIYTTKINTNKLNTNNKKKWW